MIEDLSGKNLFFVSRINPHISSHFFHILTNYFLKRFLLSGEDGKEMTNLTASSPATLTKMKGRRDTVAGEYRRIPFQRCFPDAKRKEIDREAPQKGKGSNPRPWKRRQVPKFLTTGLGFGNLSTALGYNLGRSSSCQCLFSFSFARMTFQYQDCKHISVSFFYRRTKTIISFLNLGPAV